MIYLVGPDETELLEYELENLEMVILLVSNDIYVRIKAVFGESPFSGAEVLGDIYRCSVRAENQLAVESVCRKVAPYRSVRILDESTGLEALLNKFLAEQIGVVIIIDLVECNSECLVCLVKTGEHPFIHCLPQSADLRVACLPLHKHIMDVIHH